MTDYRPIACSLHDRMESAAVLGQLVQITWRNGFAEEVVSGQIADILVRDGAEYLLLKDSVEIRLDRIDSFELAEDQKS